MSDEIPLVSQGLTVYQLDFELELEGQKVLVTVGFELVDDGSLVVGEGTLALV